MCQPHVIERNKHVIKYTMKILAQWMTIDDNASSVRFVYK